MDPAHGRSGVGRTARTYIRQLYMDIHGREDLQKGTIETTGKRESGKSVPVAGFDDDDADDDDI